MQQALAAQFGVGTDQIDIQSLQSTCPTAPPSGSFNEYQEQSALLEKARTSDLLIDFVVMTTPQNATDEASDSAIQDTAAFEDSMAQQGLNITIEGEDVVDPPHPPGKWGPASGGWMGGATAAPGGETR